MADKAHRLTDEKLEEMGKQLSAIYSRAEKEIQQTADEYFSKFAAQDEKKRKLLEQGKITEEEYTKWRKGKMMYGKRFTEMKEQCAKQLLNVNQTAIAYVNGELPEVYSINYNALAGSVDGVGGYSFALVDADTVRNLAVTDASLLPYKEIDPIDSGRLYTETDELIDVGTIEETQQYIDKLEYQMRPLPEELQ